MKHHELLESYERELVSPQVRRDTAKVAVLLHDEFLEIGSSGKIYSKSDVLASINDEASYELSNFEFVDLADGVTLVRYSSSVKRETALRSSVWVEQDGAWQMIHHQASLLRM